MAVCGQFCEGCTFEHSGVIHIPEKGTGRNGVLIVGDSGWLNEAAATREIDGKLVGTPFSGPSGWFMDRNMNRIPGFPQTQEDFLIADTTWCRVPKLGMLDNTKKYPEAADAIRQCRPYLDDLVAKYKPKVIVPMGNIALARVTGLSGIERFHGYTLPSIYGIPAIPTFHPSYIIQGNQKYTGAWIHVLSKALAIARGEQTPYEDRDYKLLLDPPISAANAYLFGEHNPSNSEWLICDIETNESPTLDEDETHGISWEIVRISFSNRRGTAITMPWSGDYKILAKEALASYRNVVFWNQAFDAPRLAEAGAPVAGTIHDAMWAWHFLQSDLPKKLGFAAPMLLSISPWKHLNSQLPAKYSALDSAITMSCWLEIIKRLKEESRYVDFKNQCTDLIPTLKAATDTGMLLDKAAQRDLLDNKLTTERNALFDKIQQQIPREARPVKVMKKGPKKLHPGEQIILVDANGNPVAPDEKHDHVIVYKPFNPASSDQRKKLFKMLGLNIPYNKKEDKESVELKHLRKWRKKYPVMQNIMDYSERQKIITAYDWETDKEGLIHPEFGFNPSTWRKSCRNPNIQTIPKRSDLAKAFRKLFIARPGYVFVECDSSAIEAVLVGYFGNSPEYIALAKRGVHKWLAEKYAGRPVSKKEPLYDKIKRIVHLSNYLGTPSRIAEEYPDDFASVAEASKLQNFYFDQKEIEPVRLWQQSTLSIAAHDKYLQTPYGQRHYFFDTLTRRDGKVVLGSDAKRAIAFMPQASASAIQTFYLSQLPDYMKAMLRAIIHDSIILEVPESIVSDVAKILYETMVMPLPNLLGLTIGAECSIGRNLGEMEVIDFK